MSTVEAPYQLSQNDCQQLIAAALDGGGDFAEIFSEYTTSHALSFEEGKVKNASSSVTCGTGIRVFCGEATGLAYCETGEMDDLLRCAKQAGQIARGGGSNISIEALKPSTYESMYPVEKPIADFSIQQRIAILKEIYDAACNEDPRVNWVSCSLRDSDRHFTVAASDGTYASDQQPMIVIVAQAFLAEEGKREMGYSSFGRRCGMEIFDLTPPATIAKEAVRIGAFKMAADPCPAGSMPVVLGKGGAGVLVHEAVGHGLEADFNHKETSVYSNRVGEKVASEFCTIVDDGCIPNNRGSITIDDEGTPGQRTVLIEKGILKGYINDKLNARLMGVAPTGNGRRESYQSATIPRMRVTTLEGGDHQHDEIIESIEHGLYAVTFGGGSVDITKGDYNFEVQEAYIIENGKITRPVKGATLVGNGPETLQNITMVANDMEIDKNAGTCGKDGQGCPVGFGTPTCLVSELVVGGTA
ncbi:MAG: metalloprotease TldD [Planctomycetes bacterium]|nr:metalloprotease TldD [Planctomycetota bacterium]